MAFHPPIHSSDTPPPQQHLSPQPPISESSRKQLIETSSSPVKSHSLHNFQLSDLRWTINYNNRLPKASSKSPLRESNPEKRNLVNKELNEALGSSSFELKSEKKGSEVGASDSDAEQSEMKSMAVDSKSKILIRIRTKNNEETADFATSPVIDGDVSNSERISDCNGQEVDEVSPKTWNLRPRKPPATKNHGGETLKRCSKAQGTVRTESKRSRNGVDTKTSTTERKEKIPRLMISLTKREIDEDIYALTGSKASRRPKKRPKNVQKQLDVRF